MATWAIAADTEEEAQRLASSSRLIMRLLGQGRLIAVPPAEQALRFLASAGPSPSRRERRRRAIIGDPERVRAGLEAVADEYGADEPMVVTITCHHEGRRRSYELIAEAFGLRPEDSEAAVGIAQ